MFSKFEAIVLRVDPLRSNKSIVTMLCQKLGIVKSVIYRQKKNNLRNEMGQLVTIEVNPNNNQHFYPLKSIEVNQNIIFNQIDYHYWVLQNYWTELLTKSSIEMNSIEKFYQYSLNVFYPHKNNINFISTILIYLWQYIADIGFQYVFWHCIKCLKPTFYYNNQKNSYLKQQYFLDIINQGVICKNCYSNKQNDNLLLVSAWFIKFSYITFNSIKEITLPQQYQQHLINLFNYCLTNHFNINLKSWSFVQNQFNNTISSN